MLIYLLKLTIIWSLLLLTYELLFKSGGRYSANRVFLLSSLFAGILLPLIPTPWQTESISLIQEAPVVLSNITNEEIASPQASTDVAETNFWTVESVLLLAYGIIAGLLLLRCMAEAIKILRSAIYGKYTTSNGYRIFESSKPHAPFSFMGWIFITDATAYSQDELDFILAHEAAHNRRKHWIDILVMQLLCIVFWFHPLVWRYRYLLKMQHEYEADYIAAGESDYEYGHFLLQQTLLKGTPSIAHSFHYSPIKNRIMMLTKKSKTNNWKYLAVLPVLAISTLLMAAENKGNDEKINRARFGDTTETNGYTIKWQPIEYSYDTIHVVDPVSNELTYAVRQGMKDSHVIELNGKAIKQIFTEYAPHTGQKIIDYPHMSEFRDYVVDELSKSSLKLLNIDYINITNAVINEKGKVIYYQISFGQSGLNMTRPIAQGVNQICLDTLDKIIPKYQFSKLRAEDKGSALYFDDLATIHLNEHGTPIKK